MTEDLRETITAAFQGLEDPYNWAEETMKRMPDGDLKDKFLTVFLECSEQQGKNRDPQDWRTFVRLEEGR